MSLFHKEIWKRCNYSDDIYTPEVHDSLVKVLMYANIDADIYITTLLVGEIFGI